MKKTIRDYDLKDKKVIIRVDFNVPMKDGKITDVNRIVQALPTIKYALDQEAKVVLLSHLGRVKEESDKAKNSLAPVAVKLEELWSKRFFNYQLTAMVDVYTILNDISYGLEKAHYDAKKLDIIENALRHIENNYNDYNISNEQLANLCGISVVYFRKLFTAAFKIPPMRYVQELRMKKAKELLGSGYYTVTEIAEMTGYSSIYSFSKTFKAVNGTSPNTFRSKRK